MEVSFCWVFLLSSSRVNGKFNVNPLPCFGAQAAFDNGAVALIDPIFKIFIRRLDGQNPGVVFTDVQMRKPGVVGSLANRGFDGVLGFLPDVNRVIVDEITSY